MVEDPNINICYANESFLEDGYWQWQELSLEVWNEERFKILIVTLVVVLYLFLAFYKSGIKVYYLRGMMERRPTEPIYREIISIPQRHEIALYKYRSSRSCINFSFSPHKRADELTFADIRRIQDVENRESQEETGDYDAGGYMPVQIGDVLHGNYKVYRKLGFGHFSTVWLCKTIYDEGQKYVALKICKSAYVFAAVAQDEIKLLKETKMNNPKHPGYLKIVQMVDTFKLLSINGIHTAIALEIMGPSLLHLVIQSEFRGLEISGVKRIIQQVLQGLVYLHEECRIIHTDIKPENILVEVKESYIEDLVERAEKFTKLEVPMPRSYVTSEGWYGYLDEQETNNDICAKFEEQRTVSYPQDPFISELSNFRARHDEPRYHSPMWIGSNIQIKIADMGNACWEEHHFSPEIQTRQYRALEVIMGAGYSYPADIWSVGCLAFELATGEMLFNPKGDTNTAMNIDHLSLIWEVLGGIPRYITERGGEAKRFFIEGKLKHVPEISLKIWKIEDVLVEKYKWKRVDAIPFASFIESLIEPDPALRLTAANALANEWLNDI